MFVKEVLKVYLLNDSVDIKQQNKYITGKIAHCWLRSKIILTAED